MTRYFRPSWWWYPVAGTQLPGGYEVATIYQHKFFVSRLKFVVSPTLKGVDRTLREAYLPGIREALNSPSPLYERLQNG